MCIVYTWFHDASGSIWSHCTGNSRLWFEGGPVRLGLGYYTIGGHQLHFTFLWKCDNHIHLGSKGYKMGIWYVVHYIAIVRVLYMKLHHVNAVSQKCLSCGRGVGVNSLCQCTSCLKWVHKRCSGVMHLCAPAIQHIAWTLCIWTTVVQISKALFPNHGEIHSLGR